MSMAGVDRRDFELDRPDGTTHNDIDPSWYDSSPPGAETQSDDRSARFGDRLGAP